jgi:hypothetical protein
MINKSVIYQIRVSPVEAERLDEMARAEHMRRGEFTRLALQREWRRFLRRKEREQAVEFERG